MRISIVMPTLNQGRFIEEALLSIFRQDYVDKEVIVMDGGSTDETMAIVAQYRDRIAVFESGKDDGQSDALAKGFSKATGDIFTWLSSDDILLPGALSSVARTFVSQPGCEWAFGNLVWIDADGFVLRCRRGEAWSRLAVQLGMLSACGPSAFFCRNLYERVGGINRKLHYMMDTELWWRFALCGSRFVRLPRYTWALRLHENAKMSGHMFSDPDDPKQLRIEAAKGREREHIEQIQMRCKVRSDAFVAPLRLALKAAAPGYVRSLVDSWHWQGKPLPLLLEKMG
ncbi:glycosyltransferase family 2 protein [Mesorhizobium sp. M0208]|uniref:glycosyltransferase family 2 protein n=1 Tax=Mesorhizobium sp. M0208 TaxID=2956916 RepID=UPI00333D5E10